MKKLESLFMVCGQVISQTLVGTEFVDYQLKTTKHILHRLTDFLCKVLILVPVGLEKPSFDLGCPLMVFSEGSPNLTHGLKMIHARVLSIAKGREK